VSVIQGSRNR